MRTADQMLDTIADAVDVPSISTCLMPLLKDGPIGEQAGHLDALAAVSAAVAHSAGSAGTRPARLLATSIVEKGETALHGGAVM